MRIDFLGLIQHPIVISIYIWQKDSWKKEKEDKIGLVRKLIHESASPHW